jgi:hypothetical protein
MVTIASTLPGCLRWSAECHYPRAGRVALGTVIPVTKLASIAAGRIRDRLGITENNMFID